MTTEKDNGDSAIVLAAPVEHLVMQNIRDEFTANAEHFDSTMVRLLEQNERIIARNETLETEHAALVQALDGMLNIRRQLGLISYEEQKELDSLAHEAGYQVLSALEA